MHRDESLARSNKIDSICDRFEKQLLAGESRRIEEVLAENTGVDRSRLLRELLLIELEIRQQQGEPASADDYVDRFPNDTDVVGAAVETVLLRHDPASNEETVDVSMSAGEETYVPGDAAEAETIVPGSNTEPGQEADGEPGGKQFGDYELLHEIARGGMGVVYKARQTKLNRIVALKMIKSGELAGAEEVKRFHAEAEAAAALDHPGIVPIYEVGQHNDQHFFSMGFVDGAGLDARLKEGPLPPKDAAGLIKTIAEAVQYAHDKGIVHRDLKPANVLLADTTHPVDAQSDAAQQIGANQPEPGRAAPGQNDSPTTAVEKHPNAARAGTARLFAPKITDFGLAKNIAGDSGMTATGQVLGTPSYMPPEQAAGKIEQVGPLADVYSLGAMLYATLTGRPPFQSANVMETLKQVLEREPVSPSQLNPAVDKDLETICLKCLEKDAANRYPTARDFASDLDCFLTGKPISARPISRPARLWRWCKRNPLGATVAGLLLFLAIAGPAVAIHQIETNRQLDNALAGEKIATATAQQKEQETATALAQVKVALANEQAALKRKDKALLETEKSIDAYVEVVENAELLKDARFKPLLKELLKNALAHYERFIEEHEDEQDKATRARMASALLKIGLINQRQGSWQESLKAFQQARRIWGNLVSENPAVPGFRRDSAGALNNLGVVYLETGMTTEALTTYGQALITLKSLRTENLSAARYQKLLADIHYNIGAVHYKTGNLREAPTAFRKALEIRKALASKNPTLAAHRKDLADIHASLGKLHYKTGDMDEALTAYQRALNIRQGLASQNPSATVYQQSLADSHSDIGVLLQAIGEPERALTAFRKALNIRQQLTNDNPTVTEYQWELAAINNNLATLYGNTGRTDEALKAHRQALALRMRLVRENPTVPAYQQSLADSHIAIGALYKSAGKAEEALAAYMRALEIREKLFGNNPTVADHQRDLASIHNNIGNLYRETGKIKEALTAYRQAVKIKNKLVTDHPMVTEYWQSLSFSLNNIGVLYKETGKSDEAITAHRQALRIREKLAADNPTVTAFQKNLAGSHYNIGDLYKATGKSSEALASHQKALAIREALVSEYPAIAEHQNNLATSYSAVGRLIHISGKPNEALTTYLKALTIWEKLVSDHPDITKYRDNLAMINNSLGTLYNESKQLDKALTVWQKARKITERLAKDNPTVTRYRFTLSASYVNIGTALSRSGKFEEALKTFQQALTIQKRLVQENPSVTEYHNLLAFNYYNQGGLFVSTGKRKDAVAAYQNALKIHQQIARRNPKVPAHIYAVASSQYRIGAIYQKSGKPAEALAITDQAIVSLRELLKREPRHRAASLTLVKSLMNRAMILDSLSRHPEAATEWRKLIKLLGPQMRGSVTVFWCISLVDNGKYSSAMKRAADVLNVVPGSRERYLLACVFSKSSSLAANDQEISETKRLEVSREAAKQCLAILIRLGQSGFFNSAANRQILRSDPKLNPLRPRDDFREFAESAGVHLPAWALKPRSAVSVQ